MAGIPTRRTRQQSTLKTEGEYEAMPKPKKRAFSITKAIKANARERLGTPPTSFPLPTLKEKAAAKPKHKKTLADLLSGQDSDA